ncbi:MAG: VC0807 family protein [Acidimicrobiales bacterium]
MAGAPAGRNAADPVVADRSRVASLGPIVVFDVAGPLVVYYSLRAAGLSTVTSLVLSGALPAAGIGLGVVRRRRLDAIGVLVLVGIVVGSALGLLSESAKLVLVDGLVPTLVFSAVCLGSLASGRPLMFRFALEAMGPDTPKGRDFADRWRYPGFRRAFAVTTVVWGLAFLLEAATQLLVIETASTSTAKTTANLMPLAFGAVVIAWNMAYARRGRRQGDLAAQAARARGEPPPPMPG